MSDRFGGACGPFTRPTGPAVPEAHRGNCMCGRWVVVTRDFTREKPLRCECKRRWYIKGDQVVCHETDLRPALCLDLDGTVRRSKSGAQFIKGFDDVELFPDVEERVWSYRDRGYIILGISNQGGVAHGFKSELAEAAEIDETVRAFKRNPFHIIKSAYHDAKGKVEPYNHRSLLRKPGYGMLAVCEVEAWQQGIVIDWDASLFVGDRAEDLQCAEAAGIQFAWAWDFFKRPALSDVPAEGLKVGQ